MDDEKAKEPEPSTSKKECQKEHSSHELSNQKRRDDDRSDSNSWSSGSYSVKSGIKMPEEKLDVSHTLAAKRDAKPAERRKRGRGDKRRRGRVTKRKRSAIRRQLARRPPKRQPRIDRKRNLSLSTTFTRFSTDSTRRSRSPFCEYCGHRCCFRRYQNELRRVIKTFKRNKRENRQQKKRKRILRSECVQAGSRCITLSPLLINISSAPVSDVLSTALMTHAEITPEMIHEALEKLTMWRQGVSTYSVLCHLMRTYPVNSDEKQLLEELQKKLRIAVFVGITTQLSADTWCLSSALQDRKLKKSHVTMFWKIYSDTLRPIKMKQPTAKAYEDSQTNAGSVPEDKIETRHEFL